MNDEDGYIWLTHQEAEKERSRKQPLGFTYFCIHGMGSRAMKAAAGDEPKDPARARMGPVGASPPR